MRQMSVEAQRFCEKCGKAVKASWFMPYGMCPECHEEACVEGDRRINEFLSRWGTNKTEMKERFLRILESGGVIRETCFGNTRDWKAHESSGAFMVEYATPERIAAHLENRLSAFSSTISYPGEILG